MAETQEERSTRLALRAVDAEVALAAARHDLVKMEEALDTTRQEVDDLRAVLRAMCMYADLSTVDGVVYSCGSHADALKRARALLNQEG
jgi:flagellar biosynthesis regulator FlbT